MSQVGALGWVREVNTGVPVSCMTQGWGRWSRDSRGAVGASAGADAREWLWAKAFWNEQ